MRDEDRYSIEELGQQKVQEIHRDRIAQVYFGETSDNETQRRARERIDWTVEQSTGPKIYDIGCSEGIAAIRLAEKKDVFVNAIDINSDVIEYAQNLAKTVAPGVLEKLKFSVSDIFGLKEIKPEYDTVILGEVLEHVYEPGNMIKRSILALKVGGKIIITTPWGYFPAPDHHQTFFLNSFLDVVPDELCCVHLSVVDGYIRYIGVKSSDPLTNVKGKNIKNKIQMSPDMLLDMTEKAAYNGTVFLRNQLDDRNALLSSARLRAEELNIQLDMQAEKLNSQVKRLKVQLNQLRVRSKKLEGEFQQEKGKIVQLSLERSVFPRITSKARILWRTILSEGFKRTAAIYQSKILQKAVRIPIVTKIINSSLPSVKNLAELATKPPVKKISRDVEILLQKAANYDFVVVCNSFPGPGQAYGGEFIQSRLNAYLDKGKTGDVVQLSNKNTDYSVEFIPDTKQRVFRFNPAYISQISEILSNGAAKIFVHSPTPIVQTALQNSVENDRLVYWFHGFEVRDYRRLYFNYSTEEMTLYKSKLDQTFVERNAANRLSFENEKITKIFVSEFLKKVAEIDNVANLKNAHIIPNYINGSAFPYIAKRKSDFKKILLIRSFQQRNYANDIATKAIEILSARDGFDEISFTICGFGKEFASLTQPLQHLRNVSINEAHLNPPEMAKLYKENGIFLCPSRFDTQGVIMGEAMASGMVCITNDVAGIPEFIDENCGILVPADDPLRFAEAIWQATLDEDDMINRSMAANKRVRNQCGLQATIERELQIGISQNV